LWRGGLAQKGINDIEESVIVAILEIITDRDKCDRHPGGDTNGVLDVKILMNKSSLSP
jgi:hypothetical protein